MTDPGKRLRRLCGSCCIGAALAMAVGGVTVLDDALRVRPILFLIFWTICLGATCGAFVAAWIDMRAVRRQINLEREELIRESFAEFDQFKD